MRSSFDCRLLLRLYSTNNNNTRNNSLGTFVQSWHLSWKSEKSGKLVNCCLILSYSSESAPPISNYSVRLFIIIIHFLLLFYTTILFDYSVIDNKPWFFVSITSVTKAITVARGRLFDQQQPEETSSSISRHTRKVSTHPKSDARK